METNRFDEQIIEATVKSLKDFARVCYTVADMKTKEVKERLVATAKAKIDSAKDLHTKELILEGFKGFVYEAQQLTEKRHKELNDARQAGSGAENNDIKDSCGW